MHRAWAKTGDKAVGSALGLGYCFRIRWVLTPPERYTTSPLSPRVATTTPTVHQQQQQLLATARNPTAAFTTTRLSSAQLLFSPSLPLSAALGLLSSAALSLPARRSLPASFLLSSLFIFPSQLFPFLSSRYGVGADESLWGQARPLCSHKALASSREGYAAHSPLSL